MITDMKFHTRPFVIAPMMVSDNPDAGGGAVSPTAPDVSRVTEPAETSTPAADARPDIERLVNWNTETDGEIPAELQALPVADVREYVTKQTARAAAEAEARAREEFTAEQERRRAETAAQAQVEEEIRWAEELDQRRSSDDPEVRAKANVEYDGNRDRFINALAERAQVRKSKEVVGAVESYMKPQFAHLAEQGHQALIDSFGERAKATGGNILLAAVEYGKELGVAEGRTLGAEEAEQKFRVEQGGRAPVPGNAGGAGAPFSNIDRSQAGAGAQMIRTALSSSN